MSMTIACPACGSKRRLDANSMGLKIQCDCGISFSVSPVFAVPEDDGSPMKWLTRKSSRAAGWLSSQLPQPGQGSIWVAAGVLVLLAGSAGVATWLMTRTNAAQLDLRGKASESPASSFAGFRPRPADTAPPDTNPTTPRETVTPAPEPDTTPPVVRPAPTPKPPTPPPVESLRASKLWDAFDLDRDLAKTKYAGQMVEIAAPGKIQRDEEGRWFGAEIVQKGTKPASRLSPQEQRWEKDGYPPNVRCYLLPGQAPALGVDPKPECVLRGVCVGRRDDPKVYMGYVVILENCEAIPEER